MAKKRKEKKSGKFGLSWGGRDPCGRDEDVDDDDGTNRILPHYSIHPLLLSIRPSLLPDGWAPHSVSCCRLLTRYEGRNAWIDIRSTAPPKEEGGRRKREDRKSLLPCL